ncbi:MULTISPECIES: ABC transporter ATP-binding protein [Asticcacaulis]|jgi:putative ABC transport system ATP-binding protein|uniref:ABC transporter related protein n=3 Tax=Asticcacaulis TaxID=76890 RepID=E8RU74_ASTEC|nr:MULTISPECIES: ABC transporter ATP-binding protein [Asticcacaulis]ADU15045.1 ABC transporter related protein [Asticcacaulis excentricus CB 48]MDC7695697.1 ABC transporter ATP-binding protein [Asticcacaulis currens]BBF81638.1 ABC transporter ATP-binding protein [Asticcacaulis excentricus]BEV12827.1 ABC transporter ATP-binding protein [Asticcacaulis sp. DW145]
MIELQNVSRLYRSDEIETTALHNINLTIRQGEFVAIMGPSGCGKSTLLNTLGTIDRPTSGAYLFNGVDLAKLSEAKLAQHRARHLGFIFQSFNLVDDLTIYENIELGLLYRQGQKGSRRQAIETAMDRVGIAHRARHFPHQLSGGQQQRAAIARAIVGNPDLILADEPTGNLDTENGAQVMDILKGLNASGATIIMVTHSPSHADQASRRVDILDGQLVASVAQML